MPASQTQRRERAITKALAAAGEPLTVQALAVRAARMGPDAPQIAPTVARMLHDGRLARWPGQEPGTRLAHLLVCLPDLLT